MDYEITTDIDESGNGGFFIFSGGRQLAELEFSRSGNVLTAYHTGVRPELEGQGIAGQLFDTFEAYVRKKGYRVRPTCSYIEAKFRRLPAKYADIWER